MSKDGSRKETYLKIYNKKFPECLSGIIGEQIAIPSIKCELRMFKSENYKKGKPIDFYATTQERGIKIYAEFQVGPSDIYNHFKKKIKFFIENIQEGIIIWVASAFNQRHINMVKDLLKKYPDKQINFFAVQIHPKVLDILENFNQGYELEVYNKLNLLNQIGSPPLTLIDAYFQMSTSYLAESYKEKVEVYDFSTNAFKNKLLLTNFREEIPYFLNFHTEKESVKNRVLRIHAGRDGIYYDTTVYNKSGNAFVKLCFSKSYNELYKEFKFNSNLIRERISPNIFFCDRNRSINFYMQSDLNNIQGVIKIITEIFERFILTFSPFTYGRLNPTEISTINFKRFNKNVFTNRMKEVAGNDEGGGNEQTYRCNIPKTGEN